MASCVRESLRRCCGGIGARYDKIQERDKKGTYNIQEVLKRYSVPKKVVNCLLESANYLQMPCVVFDSVIL